MTRTYALYFDAPPSNIERRAKQFLLVGILLLHLAFIAWVLRTQPTALKGVSSSMLVELHNLTHGGADQNRTAVVVNRPTIKPGVTRNGTASAQLAQIPRNPDSARPHVADGQLNPGAGDSLSNAAAIAAATDGVGIGGHDAGQSNGDGGARHAFTPPRVQSRWKSAYPMDAYKAHLEGEAFVLVKVAADGSLIDAHIDQSTGIASLDNATLETIRHYTFKAALKNGNAIEAEAIVSIVWRIKEGTQALIDVTLLGDTRDLENEQTMKRLRALQH